MKSAERLRSLRYKGFNAFQGRFLRGNRHIMVLKRYLAIEDMKEFIKPDDNKWDGVCHEKKIGYINL